MPATAKGQTLIAPSHRERGQGEGGRTTDAPRERGISIGVASRDTPGRVVG